jgi:hypothetical protein
VIYNNNEQEEIKVKSQEKEKLASLESILSNNTVSSHKHCDDNNTD